MSININQSKCTGCKNCICICPGNIIRLDAERKAYLKRPSDCWGCLACMKSCPVQAITMMLPPELGGQGGKLSLRTDGHRTEWTVTRSDGTRRTIITDTEEANQY